MSGQHERARLLAALHHAEVHADDTTLGIRRIAEVIHDLRREGIQIETVRGPVGTVTTYRLIDAERIMRATP